MWNHFEKKVPNKLFFIINIGSIGVDPNYSINVITILLTGLN